MEHEICRKTVKQTNKTYKWPIILSLCWVAISFMINCIIGGGVTAMFDGGLYWIGFGNMILGLALALLFWLLSFSAEKTLVLTNKRIYYSYTRKLFFSKVESFIVSYNLNKITTYNYHTLTKKGKPRLSSFTFTTPTSSASFAVDEAFYNEFVNAINA